MSAADVSIASTLLSFFAYRSYIEHSPGPNGLVLRGQHLDGLLHQVDGPFQIVSVHFQQKSRQLRRVPLPADRLQRPQSPRARQSEGPAGLQRLLHVAPRAVVALLVGLLALPVHLRLRSSRRPQPVLPR